MQHTQHKNNHKIKQHIQLPEPILNSTLVVPDFKQYGHVIIIGNLD